MEYKLLQGEDPIAFQYRVSKDKELIGTWQDVADICNRELGYEYTESKYRKDYASFSKLFAANQSKLVTADGRMKEVEQREFELKKLTQRFFDQRREFNKVAAKEARAEHLNEIFIDAAIRLSEVAPMIPYNDNISISNDGVEAIIFFADWHYGMTTNNLFNRYNCDICKLRVNEFVEKASQRLMLHNPQKLHIVCLGDAAHGAIHTSARVESEENTCEQLMHVSELMAEAIYRLSHYAHDTFVYTTYGNHMRTVQSKNESVHDDNMERIIGWWLKERFSAINNISVIDSEFYEFVNLKVCGYNVCCTHGDLDNIRRIGTTLNTLFSKLYGETIDYTVSADKHHIEEIDTFGIENTIVPALCGSDGYANDRRLYSKSGQTLMIFNRDGKDATYHIMLK